MATRSVVVRFASSTSTAAQPAAARLASLRQRVLQARSGVVKNHSTPKMAARGGAIARYFGAASARHAP